MTDAKQPSGSIKASILAVLTHIRETATKPGKTQLPTAAFSNALNSVGERLVDLLLEKERTGDWWLSEEGDWLRCTVQRTEPRVTRHFYSEETLLPTSKHLADPMTGPDHLVWVSVPARDISSNVVLEQKLRFGTRQDAFADSGTYLKHLLYKLDHNAPTETDLDPESYCKKLFASLENRIGTTTGRIGASGTVPQVCFWSIHSPLNKIIVGDKEPRKVTQCDFVGFLPPIVNTASFKKKSPAVEVIRRAKVQLWLGLDSLLAVCEESEVEKAWDVAVKELSTALHNPTWS